MLGTFRAIVAKHFFLTNVYHKYIYRRCGSHISAAKKASMERKFSAQRKLPSKNALVAPVIDVNFNIIAANRTVAGGWIRYIGFLFHTILLNLGIPVLPKY